MYGLGLIRCSVKRCLWQLGGSRVWHSVRAFQPVIGIKRETVNLWEQRTPLAPKHVKQLVDNGFRVLVQPSNRRCYKSSQYEDVGALIKEDLQEATLILGVKRPTDLSEKDLLPDKTYAMFTHTIKAQPQNMSLLDTLLERRIRVIDYECMVDKNNRRAVAFGKYAGIAGTIDMLHGLGIRLLAMGHATPFLQISMAHNYQSIDQAERAVRSAGYDILRGHLPDSIGPLTFVVNGTGNVSIGVQQVLRHLPVKFVNTQALKEAATLGEKKYIYVCVLETNDYMEHVDGKLYNRDEYFEQPQKYRSTFAQNIAPYMSVLFNATYWDARVSRILTREDARKLGKVKPTVRAQTIGDGCPGLPQRLIGICDISADVMGSVEFTEECTTIDEPFCLYNSESGTTKTQVVGDGILMCSIDNMPAQIPFESSEYFGDVLMPFIQDMIDSNAEIPFDEYKACAEVKNAVITSNGKLTPRFQYIDELRGAQKSSVGYKSKRVLVLGSGYVVPPLLDYLSRDKEVEITVASNVENELMELSQNRSFLRTKKVNVLEEQAVLSRLILENDLVISLIPWKHHPVVAEECIRQKRNLLTASYCTPALKSMETEFQNAGVTAFMEIGLDPGIDHLLTKECIDEVTEKGGQVISYRSFTGGLPAPENSNNPLRYKFSWSPEAAMSTVLNGAKYLENGTIKEIPADGSLMKMAAKMDVFPGFNLEGYPNRDSTRYIDLYGLKNCQTVIRGTLRYGGFTSNASFLIKLGLLDPTAIDEFQPGSKRLSWKELVCQRLGLAAIPQESDLEEVILQKVAGDRSKYECLRNLGLLSDDEVAQTGTPLSSTSLQLAKVLSYGANERDLIVMSHELIIDWPKKKQREVRNVSLVAYGTSGCGKSGLAMSQTVGIPAAIAAKMMLDGDVRDKGIVLPLKANIYKPILERLKLEKIEAQEISSFYPLR